MTDARLASEPFRAMGTTCIVAVTAGPFDAAGAKAAVSAARAEIDACERALSRFDPESELSRLNAAAGAWAPIGERLWAALRLAVLGREATNGRFDPTILPALVAAGYDRSFEALDHRPANPTAWRAGAAVEVDQDRGRARVARASAVDLGGIGKGFAAGRAVEAMRAAWPRMPGALVDLGGDIAVWGRPPEGGPWLLAIADPRVPEASLCTLAVETGGVATSGRDCRRFGPDASLHHLIDPATGAPHRGGPLAVSVVAPDAAWAELHSTALAVSDLDDAERYVASRSEISALLVPAIGPPVVAGRLPLVERHLLARVPA